MGAKTARPERRAHARPDSRSVALGVLSRVRRTDAYANLVLPQELNTARLPQRDAALATELAYGTLRMQGTLDWVVALCASRSLDRIDPSALDALRLGAYQLLYTQVPPYAAVSETVALISGPAAGFVNGVLRDLARRRQEIPWPQREGDFATYLQIRYAHPAWIVRLWLDELGPDDTEQLCRANNEFPGVGVRVNTARTTTGRLAELFEAAQLEVRPGRYAGSALTVIGGGHPPSWPGFDEGLFTVQDESSVLASSAVDGNTVADLCAGPGGKTTHLAAEGARVVACDVHEVRARLVREASARLGGRVIAVRADARVAPIAPGIDAVLVDAPCSGLGVLRRRPEARWRVSPSDVERSAALQAELVRAGFELLRPGGELVYAVCTVTSAETVDVLGGFLESQPEAELVHVLPEVPRAHGARSPALQLFPHVHGTDGMFVAKLRRRP